MGAPRVPERTVLFQRERSGLTYRVPALLSVPPVPTLLAFAEQRLSPDDAHAHRLVQRSGTLAGGSVRVSAGHLWRVRLGQGTAWHPGKLRLPALPSSLPLPGSGAPCACWRRRPWRSTGP